MSLISCVLTIMKCKQYRDAELSLKSILVDTKVVLMPCLCLAFKQLCYSSSEKGEISSALALPVHLIARDDNCKLLMLFLSFHLPHSSVFQLVCSSSVNQKANPKSFLQLGVPYEGSHELSQGREIP